MGKCHVSWFSFFIFQHLLSISLFFWSFLSSQSSLFGESLLSRWIFMQCEGGSEKVGPPVGMTLAFQQVSPVFPFHGPTPQLLLVEPRHLLHIPFFDCLSMRHWNGSFAFDSSRRLLCLSHLHLSLISFRVTSWHFVLTWLLSLSLIRRGSMRRSCVHDTGFCDCAGVGESGAV